MHPTPPPPLSCLGWTLYCPTWTKPRDAHATMSGRVSMPASAGGLQLTTSWYMTGQQGKTCASQPIRNGVVPWLHMAPVGRFWHAGWHVGASFTAWLQPVQAACLPPPKGEHESVCSPSNLHSFKKPI